MTWTVEKLERIPEVYRDFMRVLKPVVDSRAPEVVLKINGIHLGTIYERLSTAYDYEIAQVRQIAQTLRQRGLVQEDALGFYRPTDEGERLIRALAESGEAVEQWVPPLPEL